MNDSYRQGLVVGDRQGYERRARGTGYSLIAGVDEVGRAAWAGPMVAAAVILNEDWPSPDLTDIREVGQDPREDVHHGKERATFETIVHAGVQG